MADNPSHVEKFISYSSVQTKPGLWRSILSDRIEYAKFLIENNYNVNSDRVKDIFLSAWDNSTKDYPSPKYARPQNSKEWESFNSYILYLWEYYVESTEPKRNLPKELEEDEKKKELVENLEKDEQKNDSKDLPKDSKNDNNDNKNDKNEQENTKPGLVLVDKKQEDQQPPPPPKKEKLYEGVRDEDLVDEEIDDRILKLLGLDDVFDIDYMTYLSLLRERMAAARMSNNNMPTEEAELLTNEWKRVKGKVGRFKIKKKRINTESFGGGGALAIKTDSFFVAEKVAFPEKEEEDAKLVGFAAIAEDIAAIRKTVESIASLMTQQISIFKKELERSQKGKETKNRQDKENRLEKGGKAVMSVAKKMLAPVQSFLDRIIKFLTTVLLGNLVLRLFRWMSDKKNNKKLDVILGFIKDWWPALLAGFLLFGTSIGSLIRTVIGTLVKLTVTMARKGIPMLLNFLKANPYVAGALAVAGIAIAANEITGQREAASMQADQKAKAQRGESLGIQGTDIKSDKIPSTGDLGPTTPYGSLQGVSGGGTILNSKRPTKNLIQTNAFSGGAQITEDSGQKITGAGKDTQLVAARPGEIVISKEAVNKYGANFFLRLNKSGGGTNIPRMLNNIQLAAGGGMVGNTKKPLPSEGAELFKKGMYRGNDSKLYPLPKDAPTPIDEFDPLNVFLSAGVLGRLGRTIRALSTWWKIGKNVRIKNEKTESWRKLFEDDLKQRGQSDASFARGEKPPMFGRPDQAFNPFRSADKGGPGSGPTPIIRQIGERSTPPGMAAFGQSKDVSNDKKRIPAIIQPKSISNKPTSYMIPPPKETVEITATTIDKIERIKGQKSVGSRDIDTSFMTIYPSETRDKNIMLYGIIGVS